MSVIHGLSHKAIRLFRDEFGALAVYWIYISRANSDRVAWPSLNGLARDTGMNKATVLKARRWLVARCAIERVKKYVPPKWRELPDDERGALLQSHARTEFYRITGYVKDEAGVAVDMLYFPGDVPSDIEELGEDGLQPTPSTPYTVHGVDLPRGKPELGSSSYLGSSSELGEGKKRPQPKKKKAEPPAPVPAVTYSEAAQALVKAWVNAAGKFLPLSYDANKCLALAEEMLTWEPPVTVDDVRECTRFQVEQPRKADYRFDFLAKDLTGYRQRKQLQVVPPRPPVVSTLEAPIALTDDELAERRRLVEAARAERERMTA